MKEEALKLADELDKMVLSDDWGDMAKYYGWFKENASPIIRKLVDELNTASRELSDEEIMKLAEYHGINDWLYETSVTDFAREILKKANEK
jgi:hypothetical protein